MQAAGITPTTRYSFSPDGKFGTFQGDSPVPNGYLELDRVKAEALLSEHFNTFLEATAVKIQAWYRGARSQRELAPPPASRPPPPPDPPAPSPAPGSPSEPADSTAAVRLTLTLALTLTLTLALTLTLNLTLTLTLTLTRPTRA